MMDLIELYKKHKDQGGKEDIKEFIKFCFIQCELDQIQGCEDTINEINKDKFFKSKP